MDEQLILKFSTEDDLATPMHLEFKNVCVHAEEKMLLNNVCGDVKPGEVLAIMGPSGWSVLQFLF